MLGRGRGGSGLRSRVVWLSSSQPFPPGAGERRVPNLRGLRLGSSRMLHPGAPFLRLSEMKFASTCTGSELSEGGEGEGGVEKVQEEREEGNQGRLDTPCSFPTPGRRGANRSDQIHFPESIFCFENTWGRPFPSQSFIPRLLVSSPCLQPSLSLLGGSHTCGPTRESWRGGSQGKLQPAPGGQHVAAQRRVLS